MVVKFFAVVVFILVFLGGCSDGCEPESMKCQDNKVKICNADENWETVIDCDDIEILEPETSSVWVCNDYFFMEDEASCVLVEEDAGTDSGTDGGSDAN